MISFFYSVPTILLILGCFLGIMCEATRNYSKYKVETDAQLHHLLQNSILLNLEVTRSVVEREMPGAPVDEKRVVIEARHEAWKRKFLEAFSRVASNIT